MASDDFEKLGVEVEPSNIGKIIGHKGPQSEDISRIHTKICSNHHLFQMPNLNQIDVPHSIPPKKLVHLGKHSSQLGIEINR